MQKEDIRARLFTKEVLIILAVLVVLGIVAAGSGDFFFETLRRLP